MKRTILASIALALVLGGGIATQADAGARLNSGARLNDTTQDARLSARL